MPLTIHYDGPLVILGNFGRLLNDPRYHDASREVRSELDQGRRQFALDLAGIRDIGSAGLGLLMTITRLIRQYEGEIVLARLRPELRHVLDEMRMDGHWEIVDTLNAARAYYGEDSASDDPGD